MKLEPGSHVYFMGIGGTGMASVAGLAQQAGYCVTGSDKDLYPPMSTMLDELKIKVHTPYDKSNLSIKRPDLVVVANALSRGHEELEAMLASGISYASFPQFLGENFLKQKNSVVVTGTHGKTTTTALLAHILSRVNAKPSYLIGGVPLNLTHSFKWDVGSPFVIEGDEYDTAFFDKNSKFLHYFPKYLLINNIEFDHADIFKSVDDIYNQFKKIIAMVPNSENIIANSSDPGVAHVIANCQLDNKVSSIKTGQRGPEKPGIELISAEPIIGQSKQPLWRFKIATKLWGEVSFNSIMTGMHNAANICLALGCIQQMAENKDLHLFGKDALVDALEAFRGVKRRLEHLGSINNINIFEDFAHHPTAVRAVLDSLKHSMQTGRLIVAFEPKNATSRRSVFLNEFAKALSLADKTFIGQCHDDKRIPEQERMNTNALKELIGDNAMNFQSNEDLLLSLTNECKEGDTIIFMSSGSFSGIQHKLFERLKLK